MKTVRILILAVLALLAAALPSFSPASAQVTGAQAQLPSRESIEVAILRGSIPSGDYTAQVLFSIFPSLLGPAYSTGYNPSVAPTGFDIGGEIDTIAGIPRQKITSTLPAIVGVFNICVLVLTIIVLSYQGVIWFVDVGRTGKWDQDGEGFNMVWSPIRMAVGLTLMVPVPGGPGWNGAQYAIATIAHAGYNSGQYVWTRAVALSGSDSRQPLTPPLNPMLPNTIALIGMSEVCRVLVDTTERALSGSAGPLLVWRTEETTSEKTWRVHYNENANSMMGRVFDRKCGEITLTREVTAAPTNPRTTPILNPGLDDARRQFSELNFAAHDAAITATLGYAQQLAFKISSMMLAMDPEIALKTALEIEAFMRNATILYTSTLQQTSSRILSNLTAMRGREANFERVVANAGWSNAGYFMLTYSNLSASAANVARIMPTVSGPKFDEMVGPRAREFLDSNAAGGVLLTVRREIARFVQPQANDWYKAATGEQSGVQGRGEGTFSGRVSDAITNGSIGLANLIRRIVDPTVTGAGGWNPNPIATQIEMGHTLINIAVPIIMLASVAEVVPFGKTVSTVGAGIAGFFAGGPATAAIAAGAVGFASVLAYPVLFIGILYAYIIPIIVWAMWAVLVLGWIMLLVEAVLVASLWALSQARMDGQSGLTQHGRHGIGVIVSLITRPTIGVIAFVIGLLIYTLVVTSTTNAVYQYMIPSMTADSTFGPIGVIVVMTIVGMFQIALLIWILNLPNIMVDNLNSWLDLHPGPNYRTAESVGKITSMASGAGAAELTSTGGKALGNAISSAASKIPGSGASRREGGKAAEDLQNAKKEAGEPQARTASVSLPPSSRDNN